MQKCLFFISYLITICLCSQVSASSIESPPNVIFIIADDLGYYDLSCYGHPQIKTPVIDQLASEGMKLTSYYSGSTICTPSRMVLLTGSYPVRLGWEKGVIGYKIPMTKGLNRKAVTLAEVLKENDYVTAIAGKWHVGVKPGMLPGDQGFDSTYFIKNSNNMGRNIFVGEEIIEKSCDNKLLTERFTKAATDFIRQNKAKPFFLYIPYSAPHFPVEAHPDWKGKSNFGAYGDVVEEMDYRIGEVLKVLKEENLDENTIVVFTSDNGPQAREQSQATPYRGYKWSALEGGNRVPFIIRWPAKIKGGQESDDIVAAIDMLPTLSKLCGVDYEKTTADAQTVDGIDVWGSLSGDKGKGSARKELLFWHGMHGFHAIRQGDWKLFLKPEGAALGDEIKSPVLFNLSYDKEEKKNLSHLYPEKVKELQKLAQQRLQEINKNIIPLGE